MSFLRHTAKSALLCLILTIGCLWAQTPAVRNFGTVEQSILYRGAQPTSAELHTLADFGIKTVIDLRGDKSVASERAVVESELHLKFVNIPLSELRAPTNEQVKQILAVIDAAPKPVYVHCRRGRDRTGVAVATFRIRHDQWSNSRALQEAETYHISPLQFGMKSYIEHYRP